MNQERHYKLAEGWTLTVTQYSVTVKHQMSATSSESIGCGRLPERPKKGRLTDITCSMSGSHFYLNGFAGPSGFWMGFKTYDSPEALKAECKVGFAGHSIAGFRSAGGQEYCREILEFSLWSVKAQPVAQLLLDDSPEAEAAMDFVSMVFRNHQESVARFDDKIKGSGWTYASILKAVGPWVPVPELPVVDLTAPPPTVRRVTEDIGGGYHVEITSADRMTTFATMTLREAYLDNPRCAWIGTIGDLISTGMAQILRDAYGELILIGNAWERDGTVPTERTTP